MTSAEVAAHKARVAATFDTVAPVFDIGVNVWDQAGTRTVELTGIGPGDHVLDVCCGTGASALPAARAAAPDGSVVGVDLSEGMVARARAKAREAGVANARFFRGDMTALDVPDDWFDAVVCVFGVFFVPDVTAAVTELWRVTAPGGRLTVTSWVGEPFGAAMSSVFTTLEEMRPDLPPRQPPWIGRTDSPEQVQALFAAAGAAPPEVVIDTFTASIDEEGLWASVANSGMRAMLDSLRTGEADELRRRSTERFSASGVTEATADVLFATARKQRERPLPRFTRQPLPSGAPPRARPLRPNPAAGRPPPPIG